MASAQLLLAQKLLLELQVPEAQGCAKLVIVDVLGTSNLQNQSWWNVICEWKHDLWMCKRSNFRTFGAPVARNLNVVVQREYVEDVGKQNAT